MFTEEVTFTETVQLPLGGKVPPVIDIVATLMFNAAPEQVVAASGGVENTRPAGAAGSVSLTAMPFRV